jgi:hypothetical protein
MKETQAAASTSGVSWTLRLSLLGMLSAQFATHTLVVRYSRGVLHETFNPAAVVLFVELLKVAASATAVTFFPSATSSQVAGFNHVPRLIFDTPPLILVPATSFFAQNVLAFVALKHLQPSVFVVLSQLKIVSTTVFSMFLLRQWRDKHTSLLRAFLTRETHILSHSLPQIVDSLPGIGDRLCCSSSQRFSSIHQRSRAVSLRMRSRRPPPQQHQPQLAVASRE